MDYMNSITIIMQMEGIICKSPNNRNSGEKGKQPGAKKYGLYKKYDL